MVRRMAARPHTQKQVSLCDRIDLLTSPWHDLPPRHPVVWPFAQCRRLPLLVGSGRIACVRGASVRGREMRRRASPREARGLCAYLMERSHLVARPRLVLPWHVLLLLCLPLVLASCGLTPTGGGSPPISAPTLTPTLVPAPCGAQCGGAYQSTLPDSTYPQT